MRRLVILSIFLVVFKANCQSTYEKDSIEILSKIEDWNKGWDVKDHKLASKWYSSDAHFINAFGDKRRGKSEIEALLKNVFALPFVMSGKSETTQHVFQPLNGDIIIVHTAVIRKGQQMPDGTVMSDRQTSHLRVFQRDENVWWTKAHLISDARDKQSPKH